MLAKQPYQFITDNLSLSEIKELCDGLGVRYGNLGGGDTISGKARELQTYMGRNQRLGDLLDALGYMRDYFDPEPYVYMLISEHINGEEMAQLCQRLDLDCEALGLTPIDLRPYDHNKFFQREKAQLLHEHMREVGRLGDLLLTMKEIAPEMNIKAYEALIESLGAPDKKSSEEATVPPVESIEYENFDLRVGADRDGSTFVEVLQSPQGQVSKQYEEFPLDDPMFTSLIKYLEGLVGRAEDAVELGKQMRQLLFPGEIWSKFRECRTAVTQADKGLRIRLRIDPPALSKLPWEYCYDEMFDFLAHSKHTPLVRYPAESVGADSLEANYPIRILAAMANPQAEEQGLAQLDLETEKKTIEGALRPLHALDLIDIEYIEHTTARKLRKAISDGGFHVLHYFGHGVKTQNGEGALALEREDGGMRPLDASRVRPLLRDSSIRVVILNACELAAQDGEEPITSVARSLIRAAVPAVMAMQFKVPQKTAYIFSRNLYEALTLGKPLDQAVSEMRSAAYIDVGARDQNYWGIPVLYLRAKNGVIWQPDAETAAEIAAQLAQASGATLPDLLGKLQEAFTQIKDELDNGDREDIADDLADLQKMADDDAPNKRRMQRKLDNIEDILFIYGDHVHKVVTPPLDKVKERVADLDG